MPLSKTFSGIMINIIEQLRAASTRSLLKIKKIDQDLPRRLAFLRSKLGGKTKTDIVKIGNYLSEAFLLLGRKDRSQGSLSSAGSVWEALIVWYLNICLAGTRAVCLYLIRDYRQKLFQQFARNCQNSSSHFDQLKKNSSSFHVPKKMRDPE